MLYCKCGIIQQFYRKVYIDQLSPTLGKLSNKQLLERIQFPLTEGYLPSDAMFQIPKFLKSINYREFSECTYLKNTEETGKKITIIFSKLFHHVFFIILP